MDIGTKLKNARVGAGLTQEQAAEALGVSRPTISNWENEKTYPDILHVIRMSDLYSVSLDHLLKEDLSVKPTYVDYLEETTNTVKSRDRLGKIILITAFLLIWAAAEILLWLFARGPQARVCSILFLWVLLPAAALILSAAAAKNDYWGRSKWLLVPILAVMFLLVPGVSYVSDGTAASFRFLWVNLPYMPVGGLAALAGLGLGALLRRRQTAPDRE